MRAAESVGVTGAQSVPGDPSSILSLRRWGLRFVHSQTEADYRQLHRRTAIPFTRFGLVASIFGWLVITVCFQISKTAGFAHFAAVVLFGPMLAFATGLFIAYRPRLLLWMLPSTMLAGCVAGFTAIYVSFSLVHMPDLAMASTTVIAYFCFTIFRMLPAQAAAATLPYVAFNQYLLFVELHAGRIGVPTLCWYSAVLIIAVASGLVACILIDRTLRNSFRQERIIEAQSEALQRERTRADVAERSRMLADALMLLSGAPRRVARLVAGEVVEQRYRVVRAIGKGGMGEVHEVERVSDGLRLALKVLVGIPDRDAVVRFAREAQIAAALDHPNVVAALDVGVTQSGTLFIVMELVNGGTLAQKSARYGDVAWAVPILRQIAAALAAMHARGIVHRDLKPSNVLVDGQTAKVTDFGIASLAEHSSSRTGSSSDSIVEPAALTLTGDFMGTPLYMAPELIHGVRDAEPSADLWSFGVVAYELLTGRLPFAEPPVVARSHRRTIAAPTALRDIDIDADLRALIERCLDQDPSSRPTAEEFRLK